MNFFEIVIVYIVCGTLNTAFQAYMSPDDFLYSQTNDTTGIILLSFVMWPVVFPVCFLFWFSQKVAISRLATLKLQEERAEELLRLEKEGAAWLLGESAQKDPAKIMNSKGR